MNVLLYCRVSTADQNNEVQIAELRQVAAQRNWTIVAEHQDVISGSTKSRPALDAMMVRVKQGGIDAVACVKIDRLGRSMSHFISLVADLSKHGTAIVCTSQGIDTTKENACGELLKNILMAFAQFEKSLIQERTRAGLAVARAKGKIIGQPSKVLPSPEKQAMIVQEWNAGGRKGGCKGLAALLGGCSSQTAWKRAKLYPVKETAEEWV